MQIKKLLLISSLFSYVTFGQTTETLEPKIDVHEIPDFIVTSTLINSPIRETPKSITLFSENTANDVNALHFEDLIGYIPNLTYTGGTNKARYFQLRGLGENSQFEGETPDLSVRFLLDDFDFTGIGGIANLFDIDQVEVIHGPQSSAYGATASAGIIKISTVQPRPNATNKIQVTYGTENLQALGIAYGATIDQNGKTSYRLSHSSTKSNGFIEGNKNTNNNQLTLFKVSHDFNSLTNLITSFIYVDSENSYNEWSLNNTPYEVQNDDSGIDNQISRGVSMRFSKKYEPLEFNIIANTLQTDTNYSYDADWGDYSKFSSGYDGYLSIIRDRNSSSLEFTVNSGKEQDDAFFEKWAIGAKLSELTEKSDINYSDPFNSYPYPENGDDYYTEQDYNDSINALIDFADNGIGHKDDILNAETGDGISEMESVYDTQTLSLFTKLQKAISYNQKFTYGINYEQHRVKFNSRTKKQFYYNYYDSDGEFIPSDLQYIAQPALDDGGAVLVKDHLVGGSLVYENTINDSSKIFASYNRGYKAAGANSSTFRVKDESSDTYDTEIINNTEFGINFNNLSQSYYGKVNLFYFTRKNAQLRDSSGSGGFFNYFTENVGDAKHYGLEYKSNWIFLDNWMLLTNLSLLKARLDNNERELSNSPNYQYNITLKFMPESGFYATASLNGRDDYYESNSHNFKRDEYAILNASIGYKNGSFDISFWAKNILDRRYKKRVFYFDNYHPADAIYPTPGQDPADYNPNRRRPGDFYSDPLKYNREYFILGDPVHYGLTLRMLW